MRLVAVFTVAALIALALQTGIASWLPSRFLFPNLVVILVVDLGLWHHNATAAVMAFLIGYATDAVSGTQVGLNALLMTLVFVSAYALSLRMILTTAPAGATVVLFATLATSVGALVISGAMTGVTGQFHGVIGLLGLQALISAAVSPWVFSALGAGKQVIGLPVGGLRE